MLTHVQVTLDQPMIQILKMGLAALHAATNQTEVALDAQIQAAIDAHNETDAPAEASPKPMNGNANGHANTA